MSWITAWPPGSQYPVHLVKRGDRPDEVLERGLTDDQVELVSRKRHRGRVAVLEVRTHAVDELRSAATS
jgi:hypothetical protein